MRARLRWGVLGAARINRSVVPRLAGSRRHELVAIASRDVDRAKAQAAAWGIPHVSGSYQALLDRDDIDVVYLPLPNALHAEWTIRAAEAGKHVLCEKPIALNTADVDRIIAAGERAGVRIAEAFMYRHHAQTARVREIVAGGDVGPLRLVRGAFSFRLERERDIRWDPALGGGALWDVGCYPVSFARMAVGVDPVSVIAGATTVGDGVDTSCAGVLQFEGGVLGTFDCSLGAAFRTSMEIVGTDATLIVSNPFKPGLAETLRMVRGGRELAIDVVGEPLYSGEVDDMARQVLDGEPPALPLRDSRGNTATLVALHRSAREGRPVALSEVA